MYFNNIDLYCQVLGSIMKDPTLLYNSPSKITLDDFCDENEIARTSFFAINSLATVDTKEITVDMIRSYLQPFDKLREKYRRNNGNSFLELCLEKAQPDNFLSFYNQLKKTSLLRDLKCHGYDISPFDYEEAAGTEKELKIIQNYENSSEEDILAYAEKNFETIRARHTDVSLNSQDISEGIDELLKNLNKHQDQGAELCGHMFNSIVRGARLGTMYIRSAGTGAGKSRSSAFDAANIAFPIKYDIKQKSFILRNIIPQKVLYIVTEQKAYEVQLMVLAFISGIEERKIRSMNLDSSEHERLSIASKLIKKYKSNFFIEEINDPNLINVENTIKKNILLKDIKYIFYDYIFSSPSLLSQFKGQGIREDTALMLLSNQLKEIAKTYDVSVISSTQLNAESFTAGQKRDQRMIRGAKSIID